MIKKALTISIITLLFAVSAQATQKNKNQIIYIDSEIELFKITDSIYIHTTWDTHEIFGRFSSNGMILIKGGEALLIDTPTNNNKTEKLVKFIKDSLGSKVTKLIIGHYHDDCLGGLGYLQKNDVESIANIKTINKCKELGLPIPSTSFTDSLIFDFNGEIIDCRFFGAGHSFDNITVWIGSKRILFGGCLVKSADSKGLGNLSDAVVDEWGPTINKIMDTYPIIDIVIPGHGSFGGAELLTHTITLTAKKPN